MWLTFLGYPSTVAEALVLRLVVLFAAGPWLALLAASAPRRGSRWGTAARVAVLVLLLDQLMADFRMWSPIAAVVAALWPVVSARRAGADAAPGWSRRTAALWLIGGLGLVFLAVNLGPLGPIRYGVLFFVAFSLLVLRARAGGSPVASDLGEQVDSPADTRGRWVGRACLCSVGTLPLYWSVPKLTAEVFPQLLVAGVAGWIGVQFLCWRARQGTQRRRWPVRAVSWACGLMAGFLFTLAGAEVYFRHFYDASDSNGGLRTSRRWTERHVRFNSWGYRDREIPPAAQLEDLTRIVLLGDSFAFGWGIDEYADLLGPRLERELTGRVSPAPRVFTLARGGIDTRREMEVFRKDGIRLRPRVVVLAYHLNDTDGLMPPPRYAGPRSVAWRPLLDNSDFLELFVWHACLRRAAARSTVWDLPGMAAYRDRALFACQSKDLQSLISLIREAGASPVVVLYPYLNAPARDGPQRYALDRVAGVLAGAGVRVVDVARLVDVTDRQFHANPFDPHPSPALHAAVVPAISEQVLLALRGPATHPAAH